ncbi:hypothetical protein [Paraburkholderia phytofirmans]|jgi:hypothetical protein|nr:hypothetical protein [Paraburkholderia phytofirmans]
MGGFGEVRAVPLFYGMWAAGSLQAGEAEMLGAETEVATATGA